MAQTEAGKTVLVAGATGLVGQAVLLALLADKSVSKVHCVGRRAVDLHHPKLTSHIADFAQLRQSAKAQRSLWDTLAPISEVVIALGTTIKLAGSRAAFKAIDLEAVVTIAKIGRSAGAQKLGVVSAMGANPQSPIFYNRTKGEMEAAIQTLGYASICIARPSLIEGNRAQLLQPQRRGEKAAVFAMQILRPLTPRNYRSIEAADVAHALLQSLKKCPAGVHVLLSGDLQPL